MSYPIHHTFGPHVNAKYAMRTMLRALQPWSYRKGSYPIRVERALHRAFGMDAYTFASGREALYALLKAMNIKNGEEIIVQGYTCVVLANAIHAAGGVPVYCDIEKDTLNLDCEALEQCITPRTRAVICQHTFGIPADTKRLRAICDTHALPLIEDCAHVIPDETGPAGIGTLGDAIILSFGRDKALSGVAGGAVAVRNETLSHRIWSLQQDAKDLPQRAVASFLFYPVAYALCRPVYGWGIGKAILKLLRTAGLMPSVLSRGEKEGNMAPVLHRMPNACASLLLSQWKRRTAINDHRRMLVRFYREACVCHGWGMLGGVSPELPLQKFPLFVRDAERIRRTLKRSNIHLDDGWTGCVVCPADTDQEAANYHAGTDPNAEHASVSILSLPTHPTMSRRQAERLVRKLATLL